MQILKRRKFPKFNFKLHKILESIFFLSFKFLTVFLYLSLLIFFNPLVIGLVIIIQSIIFSIFLVFWKSFRLFGYFIFIIYLGGILMLFAYIIRTVTVSDPLDRKKIMKFKRIGILRFIYAFHIRREGFKEFLRFVNPLNIQTILASIFRNSYLLTIFLLIFLFLVLIAIVYLIENRKGSIRTITKKRKII